LTRRSGLESLNCWPTDHFHTIWVETRREHSRMPSMC
jgi:hypothetical protein